MEPIYAQTRGSDAPLLLAAGLASDNEIHGGEGALLATVGEAEGRLLQHDLNLGGAVRHNEEELCGMGGNRGR
jgi:hypothetical protein